MVLVLYTSKCFVVVSRFCFVLFLVAVAVFCLVVAVVHFYLLNCFLLFRLLFVLSFS